MWSTDFFVLLFFSHAVLDSPFRFLLPVVKIGRIELNYDNAKETQRETRSEKDRTVELPVECWL